MSLISFNFSRRKPTLPKMEPCFCNGDLSLPKVQDGYQVVCRNCRKAGTVAKTVKEAIELWNLVNR